MNAADTLDLAPYAERAYLEYAMSVVKGRALPAVQDGQKPVQRRILYAMKDMGLTQGAKPVKSARVVGEILGKYHPHGDSSAYEAMVRMAQDFTLRYPLIDGVGNFGSRDGDGAAAMRYTEARLTPIAELLLSEMGQGTVDFVPNYDGAFEEPVSLPARLPMVLLNGASGIAVGMATEIPSHNLNEITQAAIALLKKPDLQIDDLMALVPAPDFAGGGHIISSPKDLRQIYETGKGSLRVRARYEVEKLARGQWRVIVTELPPNTSSAKILAEIEEQTNPKVKTGKKNLTQEQLNTKKLMLDLLEKVRDESDGEQPVRLVFEPKSSKTETDLFINTLMAQTSLEGNVSVNLVMMGLDNRPAQKNLKTILQEWLDYRVMTVTRRLQHRLAAVQKRIHILEGRHTAFLHIDKVIKVIRESDEPKQDLIQQFKLTEMQAEDILEIRLRQLARLEGFKLESELKELREESGSLNTLLGDENEKKKLIIKELQSDMKQFGDPRRTLVEVAERATLTQSTADEPITLILSQKGWLRARAGHDVDLSQIAFKEGDDLQQVLPTRTVQTVLVWDSLGRSYSLDPAEIPKGRGDGVPIASLIDLQNGASVVSLLSGSPDEHYLLAHSGGYGFIAKLEDLHTRLKAGKAVMNLDTGETTLPPVKVYRSALINPDCKVVLASAEKRLLAFPIAEMKIMAKGRGLQLMALQDGDRLLGCNVISQPECVLETVGARGKIHTQTLNIADVENKRGRKGMVLEFSGSLKRILASET
ncbi:DNA topoisomerase IV subunit A [Alysiella filiformis]|uniref:DNA topoisomerase 4 subunit A n=1 Tax=Alysiella filiformis DSM 16848 TaxID=1120981 RepID=A0A286EFQ0_9NEIS|nr:DNA topoisomerase IV subunit A [Alysiella filiformis]QMT30503.1 DNA topoisomerase IV subunit A [Alysiella filiformis]UBQ56517.1 DNA topoisomerase IV subunit A [Alysiella filiformis DSM 16848]SOD69727.1 DNA topoisomerase IV subunit A [Alysiella filiformis DSM 16848]